MNKNSTLNRRPLNINPFSIKLSIYAFTSIVHRLSGLFLFLMIPFLLWTLQTLIETPTGHEQVAQLLSTLGYKLFMWLLLASITYHLFAGIRHVLMDMQWLPENLMSAKISAWVVWGSTLSLIVFIGFRLFGGGQ